MKMNDGDLTLYLALGAALALVIGVVWCITSGPCSSSSSPNNPATPGAGSVGAAINTAIQSAAQFSTGSSNPLENEDNGIIFGGGA
jgi:hypothetical protein